MVTLTTTLQLIHTESMSIDINNEIMVYSVVLDFVDITFMDRNFYIFINFGNVLVFCFVSPSWLEDDIISTKTSPKVIII